MSKTNKGSTALALGALGVVFGDIGTSPLYALQALFGLAGRHMPVNQDNVLGVISLIIWSITLVVSIKYVGFVMRASNEGEGGVMALVGMIKNSALRDKRKWVFVLLGIAGISLFYGDSSITPAISVLSAAEGLNVVVPHLHYLILPITLVILTALFWLQRYGTGVIGRLFGPIMLAWFVIIGAGGALQVWLHPEILHSLSPLTALHFFFAHPMVAFIAMSAVVLAITGAEALYADLGHFGRAPIAKAWFFIVFPALVLCYMGEGALLLNGVDLHASILVQLFPSGSQLAVVAMAMVATLIASQSVISGAFSLTRQAIQLNFLPKMLIKHTSVRETGQIYLPFVNFVLFVLVTMLVVVFGSSEKLAGAYGVAVSGTLLVDTVLFLVVMHVVWRKPATVVALAAAAFVPVDVLFVASNTSKIWHGGLFPILVGTATFLCIDTWMKGERIVAQERRSLEAPLESFIEEVRHAQPRVKRSPVQAVYIGHHARLTPMALRATLDDLHELPQKVVVLTIEVSNAAHVPKENRADFDSLQYIDGISHLVLRYGFQDSINVPKTLQSLRHVSPELDFDPAHAAYFVSLSKIIPSRRHNMARWRKTLYGLMARNRLSTSDFYHLPLKQTEEMQSLIRL